MKKMKYDLFEMMGKLDPQYKKILKENRENIQGGISYEQLPKEDQQLFNQLFNNPKLHGSNFHGIKGNHINTKEVRAWESPEGKQYKQEIEQKAQNFTQNSQGYEMVMMHYEDWDREFDERDWDAHYEFTFVPKKI